MGRVIAIDFGTRRTGIASTDPLRIIASPLETVPTHTLMGWLAAYFVRENVDVVVVGHPRQMDGNPSATMAQIEPLVRKMKAVWPDKQVVLFDERFTSRLAMRAMIDGGLGKMARRDKAMVDKISAAIILQGYLDSREYSDVRLS